jgi:putative iron-dependent peroxidase
VPDPLPQPVLAPLTPAAIFLVATVDEGGEAAVHDALPDIAGLVRTIGFRDPAKRRWRRRSAPRPGAGCSPALGPLN